MFVCKIFCISPCENKTIVLSGQSGKWCTKPSTSTLCVLRIAEARVGSCANNRCQNGAACDPTPNGVENYNCVCQGRFTGTFCESKYTLCLHLEHQSLQPRFSLLIGLCGVDQKKTFPFSFVSGRSGAARSARRSRTSRTERPPGVAWFRRNTGPTWNERTAGNSGSPGSTWHSRCLPASTVCWRHWGSGTSRSARPTRSVWDSRKPGTERYSCVFFGHIFRLHHRHLRIR